MDRRECLRPGGRMRAILVSLLLAICIVSVPSKVEADDHCVPGDAFCSSLPNPRGDHHNGSVVTQGRTFPGVNPNSAISHATAENATCTDCEWTVSPACLANGPNDDALCMMAVSSCPRTAILMRVYL